MRKNEKRGSEIEPALPGGHRLRGGREQVLSGRGFVREPGFGPAHLPKQILGPGRLGRGQMAERIVGGGQR